MIEQSAINLIRSVLTPLMNAGAISQADFSAFMAAATQNGKHPQASATGVLIKRKDAAVKLGISTRTFDRLIGEGTFRAIRVGRRSIRVNQAELDDFINLRGQEKYL